LYSNSNISKQEDKIDVEIADRILALNDEQFYRLVDIRLKGFAFKNKMKERGVAEVQQIIIETEWTIHIQNLVDFANKRVLRNFSLRLEMDVDEPDMHRQCVYPEKEVKV